MKLAGVNGVDCFPPQTSVLQFLSALLRYLCQPQAWGSVYDYENPFFNGDFQSKYWQKHLSVGLSQYIFGHF